MEPLQAPTSQTKHSCFYVPLPKSQLFEGSKHCIVKKLFGSKYFHQIRPFLTMLNIPQILHSPIGCSAIVDPLKSVSLNRKTRLESSSIRFYKELGTEKTFRGLTLAEHPVFAPNSFFYYIYTGEKGKIGFGVNSNPSQGGNTIELPP